MSKPMKDPDRRLGSNATFGASDAAPTLVPSDQGPPTFPAGTVLAGRYQVIDLLGIGGMGAVYKAFDHQLTRVVALKTILPEMAATPTALKRFKQEVLLAQSIIHKNVVRIFDIGEDGPTKFITMDFIEGADLKHLITQKGKLPPAEAAGIIRQACQGLEAAHAACVVHRDLKPQNIMIEKNAHVVVVDFGIAHSGQSRGVTQTGFLLGTSEYMSPEQAKTENVDARSDIFSSGLIFYELLTGKLPFQGKTVLETMFKRTTELIVWTETVQAQRIERKLKDASLH
jgi:serine/threonine protein kinase